MYVSSLKIHPTAVVDPNAQLGEGVTVGPYSIVDAQVTIGDNTTIGSHCVITGHTVIGKKNRVFTGAVIGSEPQDVKYHGEETWLEIGDGNVIREYVTINPGTGEGSKTVIGNDNWLMIQTHVGHNCVIGNHVKMANLATLGGHVTIEDYATIGGVTPVHQYVRIGCYAMVGGGFRVVQDLVPYMMAGDEPLRIYGLNQVGLERCQFSKETVGLLKKAHRIIFRSKLTVKEAIQALSSDFPNIAEISHLIEFLGSSERGLVR
jgi:UDP-N-acetylglucosamine acyltransferase